MFYFISNFYFLFVFAVGGLGFEFCVFVAGWRHSIRSEWPSLFFSLLSHASTILHRTQVLYVYTSASIHYTVFSSVLVL